MHLRVKVALTAFIKAFVISLASSFMKKFQYTVELQWLEY